MRILVDSNIVIRLLHHASPQHQTALDASEKLRLARHDLCLAPQNIYEIWSVATRPTNVNGLGLSFAQIRAEVANLKAYHQLLAETPTMFAEWEKLVNRHGIVGKNVHDAHLVAAMVVHGITHLLTFNKQDFQRFTNITVLSPADVIANPPP
jgi:predicted nucleic acid-binding protein